MSYCVWQRKNFYNRLRFDKVTAKNKLAQFFLRHGVVLVCPGVAVIIYVYSAHGLFVTSAEKGGYVFGSVCLSVCLFVWMSIGLLANLGTDFDEIFWRGRAWLKDQVIQFWWQSGSRFGSGSPKSEIRILRIGGGLCSLSTSSYYI